MIPLAHAFYWELMDDRNVPRFSRVVVVEDDPAFTDVLCGALQAQSDFEVIASFDSATSAICCSAVWEKADIVLVDYRMPGLSGMELVRYLNENNPGLLLVMITSESSREVVLDAIKLGAAGYLTKDSSLPSIISELRSICEGGAAVSAKPAKFLFEAVGSIFSNNQSVQLSHREIQILTLVGEGRQYKEIAEELSISIHTVHSHIKRIYKRLSVSSRPAALRRARAIGLL